MPIVSVIVTLVIVGVVLYAINSYIPMAEPIKKILNIVVVIVVILWLLSVFGIMSGFHSINSPRLR